MLLKKNILFSCANGIFSIQNIIALSKIKGFKFKIYGLDIEKIKSINSDFFFKLSSCPDPSTHKSKYVTFIKSYCLKNNIDVFFPMSDKEIEILSNLDLSELNTKILIPTKKHIKILTDKFEFLSFLNQNKITDEEVHKIDSFKDLKKIREGRKKFRNEIVLKPRQSRGSRGVMIINNKKKFSEPILNRNCVIGPYKDVYNYIKQKNINLKNFFLMKYYSNTNFDIDCYASKSEIKYLVVRRRDWVNHLSSINEACTIERNLKIEKLVKKIIIKLNFSGILDLDISLDKNKNPHIIDMSGRLSGSVSSGLTANMNIFEIILKDIFNIPYKKKFIKNNVYVRLSNIFVDLNATNKLY